MKQRIFFSVTVLIWSMLGIGCTISPKTTESADTRADHIACKEPRPEACTMQYDPVCGEMADGRSKTYSNACVACTDRLVTGYLRGACATVGKPAADR
jgi:hypothetical protein